MDKLGDLIGRRMGDHHLGAAAKASEVLLFANQLLQESGILPRDAKAMTFKQGTLLIGVRNSLWAQEVRGLTLELAQKLQKKAGLMAPLKVRTKSLTNL
jgi:hypothetical protein